MVLRVCDQDQCMRPSESSIKVSKRGWINISKALSRLWPPKATHAQLWYDNETGLMAIAPAAANASGARMVTTGAGKAMRLTFIEALRFFGLMPAASVKLAAEWKNERVEAHWPAPWPRQEVSTTERMEPAARKERDPQISQICADSGKVAAEENSQSKPSPRDIAKTREMEAAEDFEDSVPPKPTAEELLDAKQIQKEFAIKPGYFYLLCSEGKFPRAVSKRGHACLWRRPDVEAWSVQRVHRRPVAVPAVSGTLSTPPEIPAGETMTMVQVAAFLEVSPSYLYRLRSAGKFPAEAGKRGRESFWSTPAIEAWVAKRQTPPPAKIETSPNPSPVGQPRCSNCAAAMRMREDGGICGQQASPRFAKRVLPRDSCSHHKPWRPKQHGM